MRNQPLKALSVAFIAGLAAASPAFAEDGVAADKIIFGQAAALDGPTAALGQGMKAGINAAFAEANKAGGVKGRKLELKSVDDGYEPTKSIEAVNKLLGEDKVFAIAGAVGTPTAVATQPLADKAGAPFIGAFTGTEVLRAPYKPSVINVRGQLFRGNRGDGRAPHQGSRRDQDRHHVSGRRLRPGWPRRREEGARKAQHEARRRGHLRAQYRGGQRRAARRHRRPSRTP